MKTKTCLCPKCSSKMSLVQNDLDNKDFLVCKKCKYSIELVEEY